MRVFELNLSITADKMLSYYRGHARLVQALDNQGLRISFPAQALRPFVTDQGVQGVFRIRIDDDNKLIDVQKIR